MIAKERKRRQVPARSLHAPLSWEREAARNLHAPSYCNTFLSNNGIINTDVRMFVCEELSRDQPVAPRYIRKVPRQEASEHFYSTLTAQ